MKQTLSIKYVHVEGTDSHLHSYGPDAPVGYTWCKRCRCWVSSKCDHRSWPCRSGYRVSQLHVTKAASQ